MYVIDREERCGQHIGRFVRVIMVMYLAGVFVALQIQNLQCLFQVQRSFFAVCVLPLPIVQTVSYIAACWTSARRQPLPAL